MKYQFACIQMTSTGDVAENLSVAKKFIQQAAAEKARLVVLPEMFALIAMEPMDKIKMREEFGLGPIQEFLSEQAAQHKIWIVGGTIPIAVSNNKNKARAGCLVFDDKGKCVGRYDKIHLFDASLQAGKEVYSESNIIESGDKIVVVSTPFGKLGLAVCYDVRFPELFREMLSKGVEIIALPSAFTYTTGAAHWNVLVRARAIENLSYIVAGCQTGTHSNGRKTYGHSMLVNPWGEVLASLPEKQGVVVGEIDLDYLHKIRKEFPALLHRKIKPKSDS